MDNIHGWRMISPCAQAFSHISPLLSSPLRHTCIYIFMYLAHAVFEMEGLGISKYLN